MEESEAKRNPHPLRLFFRFAVLGVICFLLLAFILFQVWARMFERYILSEAKETRAKYISALVIHTASPEDFRAVKKGADWKAFGKKMAPLFSLAEVVRVKVYSSGGDLIWSDA
ncbi:MAG: hypothetical protein HYY81_02645, partial [Deltaproteobacteria bacterium]|nr:hypothetical protein [Deltaproteobacteria bacterium]